jgi:CelD/BcsL family acetyltransferase involved in cellulose biosynthesis
VDVFGLVNVAWEGELANLLGGTALTGGETTPRYRLPRLPEIPTPQAHLATIGRSSRRAIGQYRRRADRAGARITFEMGRDALDTDVLDLCKRTADKHAPNYYPPTELGGLIVNLGTACRIIRVELDGVLLATSICLLDADRAHFWAGGCLYPAELNWSPQYVLFHAELEAGFRLGRPMLEFGRRNDEFKTRYGLRPHRLGRFVSERRP